MQKITTLLRLLAMAAILGACNVSIHTTAAAVSAEPRPAALRPPAVPLVTHDPYFSVWSFHDRLTAEWTRHWTGSVQAMCGMARIDGRPYRFMGPEPAGVPAMAQAAPEVTPTRTTYHFEADGVQLTLTFLSPLLPDDMDVLARPVTYLTWEARATDGRPHRVVLHFDASAEWAVNTADQPVVWGRRRAGEIETLFFASDEQPVLAKKGDNLRIDWGHFYVAAPKQVGTRLYVADHRAAREGFAAGDKVPEADDARMPRPANDAWPVLACVLDMGTVGARAVMRRLMLAYDDVYAVEYMGRRLRPYWRRGGMDAGALLEAADRDYPALVRRCRDFDSRLVRDLERAGGPGYADLATLAYRQCLAAHKLAAGEDGAPLVFSKENFSNGCIGTVDVLYPAAPFFLLLSTDLLRAQTTPIMDYAASPRWRFPFAPHDLGTYPLANGQVYGGGEKTEENQMPVEESGNMLLLLAAMAKVDSSADYALRYWPTLTRWAQYLREKGMDPENQLCTDDFAGHLAHNTNLSLKAILAIGAFGMLCDMAGKKAEGAEYRRAAQEMAREWARKADDGDHYRLAFDRPGTWSQKYNLVWDRLLVLKLFPPEIARREMAFYRTKLNPYGLPLDNRSAYTKLDWVVWTATLTGKREDFDAVMTPTYRFVAESPSRVPLTDWYWTTDAKRAGFQARSVVGGVYLPMLSDLRMWRKWAGRARK